MPTQQTKRPTLVCTWERETDGRRERVCGCVCVCTLWCVIVMIYPEFSIVIVIFLCCVLAKSASSASARQTSACVTYYHCCCLHSVHCWRHCWCRTVGTETQVVGLLRTIYPFFARKHAVPPVMYTPKLFSFSLTPFFLLSFSLPLSLPLLSPSLIKVAIPCFTACSPPPTPCSRWSQTASRRIRTRAAQAGYF